MQAMFAVPLKRALAGVSVLLLTLLALAGCGSSNVTPPATPKAGAGMPSATLRDPAYWEPIVGLHDGDVVERVSFGHLVGDASLQALVIVRVAGGGGFLNVYVYDRIADTHPHALFALPSLLLGDARISPVNTLLTAQSDGASDPTDGSSLGGGLVQDLFREFKWSASAGAFVQVAFPDLFPDLTRWQAEADQAKVIAGQETWKLDATKTAAQFTGSLLKWSTDAQTTLLSGGGAQNLQAVVRVASTNPGGAAITVTLSRFDEAATSGIWEVTQVRGEAWMSLTSPQSGATLTSPVTATGTGSAFEGDAGTVFVLNHLYTAIGHARVVPIIQGKTSFTATVSYGSSFQGGSEEGVIAFYVCSQADGSIATATLIKVLLSA